MRILEGVEIEGDLSVQDDIFLGLPDSAAAIKELTAQGSSANIGIDFIPKGTGILRVPTGYEANIGSETRAIVNKAYTDSKIAGLALDTTITAPGAGDDGKAITWDNTNLRYKLTAVAAALVSGQGITVSSPNINLGGVVTGADVDVNVTSAHSIYVRANNGANPAGFRAQAVGSGDNQAIMYGGGASILVKATDITVTANITGAMKYAADYSANFNTRSMPDVDWITKHLGQKNLAATAQNPGGPQDGHLIRWNNVAGEYELVAGGSAMAIGNSVGGGSPKSVLFVNASGALAQDNANFAWDYTNIGLGIGLNSPTAYLHLRAGTTTRSAFKFTTGSQLTTIAGGVQNGAWEYDGTHVYFIIGSTRYQIDQQAGGGGGHVIENNGTPLTARANLNFRNGLSAADNNPDTDAKLGGTLIENTSITGTGFTLKGVWDLAVDTAPAFGEGWWLANTAAAAVNDQRYSPSITWEGQGWKTAATAGSRTVKFSAFVMPIQDVTEPRGVWGLQASIGTGPGIGTFPFAIETWYNTSLANTLSVLHVGNGAWGAGTTGGGIRIFTDELAGVYIGHDAGNPNGFTSSTQDNVAVGALALNAVTSGWANVAIGANTGRAITTGIHNTLVGEDAGNHLIGQTGNTLIGAFHVDSTFDLGNYNVAVGYQGFFNASAGADQNIAIGYQAGQNQNSGDQNIYIGSGTQVNSGSASGQLSIQNVIYGVGNTAVGSNVGTGSIGIGVRNPSARFHVTQDAKSSGWQPAFMVTPGAHTSMTAATEFVSNDFAGASQQWAAGTVATQRFNYFRSFTLTGAAATATFTHALTAQFDAPVASTNAAITNAWGIGTQKIRVTGLGTGTGTLALFEDSANAARFTLQDVGVATFNSVAGGSTNRFVVQIAGATALNVSSTGDTTFGGGNDLHIGRGTTALAYTLTSTNEVFLFQNDEDIDQYGYYFRFDGTQTATSGSTREYFVMDTNTLTYASGTVAAVAFGVKGTVNQQGTGPITWIQGKPTITDLDGSLIGFDWDPVTPSNIAGTHLAWRNTSGNILVGGTTLTAGDVLVDLQSTSRAIVITRFAGDVATPVNGMIHYNSTSDTFRFRQNGAWVGLGGGGGSPGGAVNELQENDGAGGFAGTKVFSNANGDLTFGDSGLSGAVRTLLAAGSAADVGIDITPKGAGSIKIAFGTGYLDLVHSASGNEILIQPNSQSIVGLKTNSGGVFMKIQAAAGVASDTFGEDLKLGAGDAYNVGNTDGGHTYLYAGIKNGSGKDGNIGLHSSSVSNWQSMEKGIFINAVTTMPTGNPTGGIFEYVDGSDDHIKKFHSPSGVVRRVWSEDEIDARIMSFIP